MELCIDAGQLRAALADIEAAERNGFHHCLAVFKLASAGEMLDQNRMRYSDLLERAHPTDGNLNWGRFQRVSARHHFEGGKLVPIPADEPGVMASDARHCGNCADGVPGGPDNCSKCGREQQYSHWTPRFDKTYCSQCGGVFGPGDQGYSHCADHQGEGKP